MSVVEQRYQAVLEVRAGSTVTDVAERFGVCRQTVHEWLARYRDDGLTGLADRSSRPRRSPGQTAPEVEALVCELRRNHPRWGARRILFELGRIGCPGPIPSRITVHRILVRHGLVDERPRRRRREEYLRWERDRPMELWQMDIVGGVMLADGREAKVVTGVDDHSRFCVIAAVVPKATGRAVCLALVAALRQYGVPDEVLTDNGKQFTARFNAGGGEVMFDRICRENAITYRLTKPRSPTTTGKVERFHLSLRRELLDEHPPFVSVAEAQATIDAFRHDYNTDRPHQALDMAFPADRFRPNTDDGIALTLPPSLTAAADEIGPPSPPAVKRVTGSAARATTATNHAVEVTRTIPASGNMTVSGQQFWLGPAHAGREITLWADTTVVHLLLAGVRLKTVPSRFSLTQLHQLLTDGGRPAGPSPINPAPAPPGTAIEVERTINACGLLALAGRQHPVGFHLAGQRVTVRIDHGVLHLLGSDRAVLRSLPNPLTTPEQGRIRDARPAGPAPAPDMQPLRVDRRVSSRGSISIARQKIQVGIGHAGRTVTVEEADTTFRIHHGDELLAEVARTTTRPIARFKARKPEPPRRRPDILAPPSEPMSRSPQ
ncbi:IS481 family transposase [Amorphoplanes digitatis]|uniref:IS481 family transposase n=1 Tax=Actinoplanes digitatis TaxID=1868 RepID=UPI0035ED8AB7